MWEIIFYEKPNGRCPAKEFLDGLSPKNDLPYIVRLLNLLEEFGNKLERPHVAYLRDDIWELRVKTRSGQFRFFHFYSEIDRAIEFRQDYLARKRGQR
jgi:hypothetical protein